ncbi:MAG: NUDIX hydrolase [Planctomycetia bacterium]|nr:NUDIX hydrolase [Planctomycetia bacterium]
MKIERYGAVAIVNRDRIGADSDSRWIERQEFIVIRRSDQVIAPGALCFPGGGIEPGETPEIAVVREFREEIGTEIIPVRKIWENITPWNVHLDWFAVRLKDPSAAFVPQKSEVAAIGWRTLSELMIDPDLLKSNVPFLNLLLSGEIELR